MPVTLTMPESTRLALIFSITSNLQTAPGAPPPFSTTNAFLTQAGLVRLPRGQQGHSSNSSTIPILENINGPSTCALFPPSLISPPTGKSQPRLAIEGEGNPRTPPT